MSPNIRLVWHRRYLHRLSSSYQNDCCKTGGQDRRPALHLQTHNRPDLQPQDHRLLQMSVQVHLRYRQRHMYLFHIMNCLFGTFFNRVGNYNRSCKCSCFCNIYDCSYTLAWYIFNLMCFHQFLVTNEHFLTNSDTLNSPFVNVPVLSNTIVVISATASK